jgi:hypothetical protein
VLASFTDAAGNTESGSSTVGVLPLLTIANNSLLVSPNGSVSLGISSTQEPTPDDTILEPISKSPEEDNEASELYETEEVLGVVFPADEDAALPLNPSKEALHKPASHIAA